MKYIISLALAFLFVFSSKQSQIYNANIIIKLLGVVVAYFGAFYGLKLGSMVRRWIMPEYVITDGSVTEIVKTKVFWAFGLQTIGCVFGSIIAAIIFFNIAGPSKQTVYQNRVKKTNAEVQPYLEEWQQAHPREIAEIRAKVERLYVNNPTAPDEYGNVPLNNNLNPEQRAAAAQFEIVREQCNDTHPLDSESMRIKSLVCRHRDDLEAALRNDGICHYAVETDKPWFHCV